MKITKKSIYSGTENTREIDVDPEKYQRWAELGRFNRPFVQDEFPHLSVDDREFLMTGVTPEEWDALFPPDEDDDPDEN